MKRKLTVILLAAVCTIGISACQANNSKPDSAAAATAAASTGSKADYESALAAANKAMKEAKSVDGLWRDTGKILKGAEKAAKAGDYAKATKMAKTAEFQGHMGASQAKSQKNVGTPSWMN
ncbi:MAG: SoxXA-binding protein [gamma proteobacterium symbiont of Bathyaustriella thionipta]|nr:SoxXA-binding protein [gamma proteobacterium symbiont of Bathyaustriella thionipta]